MLLFRLYIAHCRGENMDSDKELLLKSGARLYSLGVELEAARDRLKQLVAQGVSYDSEEMLAAYREFSALDGQWKAMEAQHVALRDALLREGQAQTE